MGRTIALPGPRDRPATLDEPTDGDGDEDGEEPVPTADPTACVVACPPHPQFGGRRTDRRLRAVSDALTDRGVACLRFDYGAWDEGRGERRDAAAALEWARDRYDRIGLFGYSFGAGVALCVAAGAAEPPAVTSVLAPPATIDGTDVPACLDRLAGSVQVVLGERDTTVDAGPVAELARERGDPVAEFPGDHHFVGQTDRVGTTVADFLVPRLREAS